MNLQDIRSQVSMEIGLSNSSGGTEQGFIDTWANEACQHFLEETKCKVEAADVTLTVGSDDYELNDVTPNGVLVINQLQVTTTDGQVIPLASIDPEEMLWRRRYPGAIPIRYYAMQGANLLMLYPVPTQADTMTIYYVPQPTTLAEANKTTDLETLTGIPALFHEIVLLWVLYRAGRYRDDESSQNGMMYLQLYQAEVKKARGKIRRIQGRKRPFARGGRRQRMKYYPAYPSQDVGD